MKYSLLKVVLAATLLTTASLAVGTANAFELQTLEDERTNLHNYVGNGQWTVVMLWGANCKACEEEKPLLEAFHKKYKDSRAHAIGVSIDGIENIEYIRKNIAHHGTSYTNLAVLTDVFFWQFTQETGKEYIKTPTYLLYAPDGTLSGVKSGKLKFELLEQILEEE